VSFQIANSRTLLDTNKFLGDGKQMTEGGEEVLEKKNSNIRKSWFVQHRY